MAESGSNSGKTTVINNIQLTDAQFTAMFGKEVPQTTAVVQAQPQAQQCMMDPMMNPMMASIYPMMMMMQAAMPIMIMKNMGGMLH